MIKAQKKITFDKLKKYDSIYSKNRFAGAGYIINKAFGFSSSQPVPLSISHGVDFGMMQDPMDMRSPEPLHWAYNSIIEQRTKHIKPTVSLPHPWWFVAKDHKVVHTGKKLVIAAPPGETNDRRLLEILDKKYHLSELDILIKHREGHNESLTFWKQNGLNTLTAGAPDNNFYFRLYKILREYSEVICCTFSSAAIFASSIEKEVTFLRDYWYKAYEVASYESFTNFASPTSREIVRQFVGPDHESTTKLAQNLLGFTDKSLIQLKNDYIEKVEGIASPVFTDSKSNKFLVKLSTLISRPGLANLSLIDVPKRLFSTPRVSEIEINEISVWLDGASHDNLKIKPVEYVKGITEPGASVN